MLPQALQKIKSLRTYLTRKDIYTCLTIVFVAIVSFFLGALWSREVGRLAVTIKTVDMSQNTSSANPVSNPQNPEPYVGNENSKIYQLSSCLGAKLISDQNRIWFATKADAEAAGYVAAKNCKM